MDTTNDREYKAVAHNSENNDENSPTANKFQTFLDSNKPADNNKETDNSNNKIDYSKIDNNKENDNNNEENNNNKENNDFRRD